MTWGPKTVAPFLGKSSKHDDLLGLMVKVNEARQEMEGNLEMANVGLLVYSTCMDIMDIESNIRKDRK